MDVTRAVRRCMKLNPGLKANRFQKFNPMKRNSPFILNLICELAPLLAPLQRGISNRPAAAAESAGAEAQTEKFFCGSPEQFEADDRKGSGSQVEETYLEVAARPGMFEETAWGPPEVSRVLLEVGRRCKL